MEVGSHRLKNVLLPGDLGMQRDLVSRGVLSGLDESRQARHTKKFDVGGVLDLPRPYRNLGKQITSLARISGQET